MSRSFELLQLAYVRTIQQPIQTTLSVRPSFRISFQTQIWEDCCASPFGRSSQTGKIFSEIFRISVAQLFLGTAYDHRPDGAEFYQARRSFELLAYK
jgi:hypothetical protein